MAVILDTNALPAFPDGDLRTGKAIAREWIWRPAGGFG
jgi:hypothetical protein